MGFWSRFKDDFNKSVEEQKQKNLSAENKEALLQHRRIELDEQGVIYCPKCLSTSVQPFKKGFGLGKAVVGGVLLGGVGLLGGAIGKDKIEMHCLKCGNKYKSN